MPLIPRRSVIKSGHTDATNATNASFPLYPVEGKNTNERERKRKGGERYRGKEALVALVVYATENRLCGFLSDADGENRLRTRFPLLLIFERERRRGGERSIRPYTLDSTVDRRFSPVQISSRRMRTEHRYSITKGGGRERG